MDYRFDEEMNTFIVDLSSRTQPGPEKVQLYNHMVRLAVRVGLDAPGLILDPTWKRATVLLVLAAPSGRTQLLVWSLPSVCFREKIKK